MQQMQTNAATGAADVAVVDAGEEANLWWFEWVVLREGDVEEENTALVGGVSGPEQRCDPVEEVVAFRTREAATWRLRGDVHVLLEDALSSGTKRRGEVHERGGRRGM